MEILKALYDNIELYNAGLPHFPRNFNRDSFVSGILMKDANILKNQLIFAAKKQGREKNPITGEEAGKIYHEYPEYFIDKRSTKFNACDTTALFLIAHFYYQEITGDNSLIVEQRENILHAVEYIKSHLVSNIFYENPLLANAERFALKVTYWKDSEIIKRENGMPVYPISYFLAHAVNLCGIRCAGFLLDSDELKNLAEKMKEGIARFYNPEKNIFYIAIDALGPIEGINSDFLHALFYLEENDLTEEMKKFIEESAQQLETPLGYLALSPQNQNEIKDNYHSGTVWPYEQAIIHQGAKKFNLVHVQEVSRRILDHLDTAPELFVYSINETKKSGCDPQLWTIAAKKYFLAQNISV